MGMSGDPRMWAQRGEAMEQYTVPDLRKTPDVTPDVTPESVEEKLGAYIHS